MRAFSVSYNFGSDETKIAFSKDFKEEHYILRLDILKDAIYDLQTTYDKTLLQKREINLATGEIIKEGELMTDAEYQQMMEERQQILEEAFDRAYTGFATEEDWAALRYECGLSALMRKENHVNSEIRVQQLKLIHSSACGDASRTVLQDCRSGHPENQLHGERQAQPEDSDSI